MGSMMVEIRNHNDRKANTPLRDKTPKGTVPPIQGQGNPADLADRYQLRQSDSTHCRQGITVGVNRIRQNAMSGNIGGRGHSRNQKASVARSLGNIATNCGDLTGFGLNEPCIAYQWRSQGPIIPCNPNLRFLHRGRGLSGDRPLHNRSVCRHADLPSVALIRSVRPTQCNL